jgi:hypothetical protein
MSGLLLNRVVLNQSGQWRETPIPAGAAWVTVSVSAVEIFIQSDPQSASMSPPRRKPEIDPDMPVPLIAFLSMAIRHFGAGALVAGVFGMATLRIYEDLAERNEVLVELIRENVAASQRVSDSIHLLTRQLEKLPSFRVDEMPVKE